MQGIIKRWMDKEIYVRRKDLVYWYVVSGLLGLIFGVLIGG